MTSTIRKLIGSRIKAHRKNQGVTQEVLAEALGCESTTLGRYERGEYAPDGEQLVKLAQFFGVTPMDFLPGDVDIHRQAVLDLRANLTELLFTIDDLDELQHLIAVVRNSQKKPFKPR